LHPQPRILALRWRACGCGRLRIALGPQRVVRNSENKAPRARCDARELVLRTSCFVFRIDQAEFGQTQTFGPHGNYSAIAERAVIDNFPPRAKDLSPESSPLWSASR
jgi:hypothetical protein